MSRVRILINSYDLAHVTDTLSCLVLVNMKEGFNYFTTWLDGKLTKGMYYKSALFILKI